MVSMVALLASDALWTTLPARAANFNVATASQLSSDISVRRHTGPSVSYRQKLVTA